MKKYIIGLVLGVVLFTGGVVFAKELPVIKWYFVDKLVVGDYPMYKTFDEDTNIVCYSFINYRGAAISCLKNN